MGKMRINRILFVLLIVLFCVVMVTGCGESNTDLEEEKKDEVSQQEPVDIDIEQYTVVKNPSKDNVRISEDFAVIIDSNGSLLIDGQGSDGFVPDSSGWGQITNIFPVSNGLVAKDINGELHLSEFPDTNIVLDTDSNIVDVVETAFLLLGLTSEGKVELLHNSMDLEIADVIMSKLPDEKVSKIRGGGAVNAAFLVYLRNDGSVGLIYETDEDSTREGYEKMSAQISTWSNIVDISSSDHHIIGLKSDGTVVAAGMNNYYDDECKVQGWSNIVMIAAGDGHSVGVDTYGNVVVCGANGWGQLDVAGLKNIVYVDAGGFNTIAVDKDGYVYITGQMDSNNIIEKEDIPDENGETSTTVDVGAHKCIVKGCNNDGSHTIIGLNETEEYYCDKHYSEMVDTYNKITKTCMASGCNKVGTHSIVGLNGTEEYYCDEHFQEMKDILNDIMEN